MYPETQRFRLWQFIVTTYAERALSFHSDKLSALSGIAKYLEPSLGPTYLAGLWRNQCMVAQLAWGASSPSIPKAPCKYKTPSWSWAVTDQPLVFGRWFEYHNPRTPNEYLEGTCTILDAQTTLATDDPTGPVNGGFLLVEGYLNDISIHSDKTRLNGEELDLAVYLDRPVDGGGEFYLFSLYYFKDIDYNRDREGDWLEYIVYLILTPIQGRRGSYERCGVAQGEEYHSSKPTWGTDGGNAIPSEEYSGPERGHGIRIF